MNRELSIDAFDYHLPAELIARQPPTRRSASRMMVIDRSAGKIAHHRFEEFPSFVRAGDLVVLNDTRVRAARFLSNDGRKEIVRLSFDDPLLWRCLVKPGKKMRAGHGVEIGDARGVVEEVLEDGSRVIRFDREVSEEEHGRLALPHYLGRDVEPADAERYQTVYACRPGAIAAPTAGLHFTPEILKTVAHDFVTLHVGPGTFQPVKAERVRDHRMHEEFYSLDARVAERIAGAERCVAVGTTVARVLESCGREDGSLRPGSGATDLFIYPPYRFRVVDVLLTNFHLPKSTLLMLVSAFAGSGLIRAAYAEAIEQRYRFFSYGDCMLIL